MAKSKKRLTPSERLKRIAEIIELADQRALAADGPVSHVRDELSDAEWREIYVLAKGDTHA